MAFSDVVMYPVNSSNVAEIGYDSDNMVAYVSFISNGTTYWYAGVDVDTWESFLNSPSKGQFVWRVFRNGGYEYGHL
jgi:hypothetical protein